MAVEFRQNMYMHLNGGNKFSELRYNILADGKPTGIKRFKRTNGSPKYLITLDVFVCGEDRFDVMATKGVGMNQWLESHASKEQDRDERTGTD